MKSATMMKRSWKDKLVNVVALDPSQQTQRIHDAVERRAYQIFEGRPDGPEGQLEDWQRAESEVIRPLECGFVIHEDKISLNTDVSVFEGDLIEVCPEPFRLVICGKPRLVAEAAWLGEKDQDSLEDPVFRLIDLSVEIDPTQVTTKFNGPILEISMARASRTAPN